MSKKDETVQPGGGVDGERDPLTVGATTYGEDIKGNSTHDGRPAEDSEDGSAEEED